MPIVFRLTSSSCSSRGRRNCTIHDMPSIQQMRTVQPYHPNLHSSTSDPMSPTTKLARTGSAAAASLLDSLKNIVVAAPSTWYAIIDTRSPRIPAFAGDLPMNLLVYCRTSVETVSSCPQTHRRTTPTPPWDPSGTAIP